MLGCSENRPPIGHKSDPGRVERYWSELEEKIVQWDSQTLRHENDIEQYITFCPVLTIKNGKIGSVQLGLSTARAKSTQGSEGAPPDWIHDSSCVVEKEGVFVMPPGVFVRDVRDAIPIWRSNLDNAFLELSVLEDSSSAKHTQPSNLPKAYPKTDGDRG